MDFVKLTTRGSYKMLKDLKEIDALKSPKENTEEEGSIVSYVDAKEKLTEAYPSAVASDGYALGVTYSGKSNIPHHTDRKDTYDLKGNYAVVDGKIINKYQTHKGMTKEEYISFHSEMCEKMKKITIAKNADYTGNSSDPFANFKQVETDGICSVEIGFLTRMSDKWSRIRSLMSSGGVAKVLDESLEDTIIDLANYLILFAGYLRSKRG